eukprot:CAMPEP_0116874554 /NCGR_PEP_ID=MMETSP0463-20121206/6025_1 /TAXON_ID=181622 /ORGANISM="Strombidinopsis sp, Strain SopsisLIS2011" /LENGTH=32 /DNA_ID= /DNA_START= /DNA_END= /DNA_ORIENTATION=
MASDLALEDECCTEEGFDPEMFAPVRPDGLLE